MPLKTHQDEPPALNLTPMIDVLFLLIIFFMVGTKFAQIEPNLPVDLPRVAEAPEQDLPPPVRTVYVLEDGSVRLDERTVSLEQLTAALYADLQKRPEMRVVVRGDGQGRFQSVASVLSSCQSAGVRHVAVAVRLDDRMRR